jgi:hypothetical protein
MLSGWLMNQGIARGKDRCGNTTITRSLHTQAAAPGFEQPELHEGQ